MTLREKVDFLIRTLDTLYPDPQIPLRHSDPFTFLVAVMLSAQTTDKRVNEVTPALFAAASTPEQMASLPVERIVSLIHPVGLAPTKGRNLQAMSRILVERYGGEVPRTFEELEALPGVGHKTASVIMSQAFGVPAFPVDTHIHRLMQECGADRAGCQTVVSPASLDAPALADHLLRAGVFSGAGSYFGARCDHGPAQSPGAALIFTAAAWCILAFSLAVFWIFRLSSLSAGAFAAGSNFSDLGLGRRFFGLFRGEGTKIRIRR